MEYLYDLLILIVPAGLVLYGMYLTVLSFLSKEREKMLVDLKTKNTQTIIPVRLQAGERLCLLLERITPNNLVRRTNPSDLTAGALYGQLIHEVREEFSHNFSQQVYFSEETWEAIKMAVEDVITILNQSRQQVDGDANGLDLAKHVFAISLERKNDSISHALRKVRGEIQLYF